MFLNLLRKVTLSAALLTTSLVFAEGRIGEIKTSFLSQEDFQKLYGTEWVLMDGKTELSETNFLRATFGWKKVPDARGQFLRMRDYGIGVDQDGDAECGVLRDCRTKLSKDPIYTDTAAKHSHGMNPAGAHTHTVDQGGHSHLIANTGAGYDCGYGHSPGIGTTTGNGVFYQDRYTGSSEHTHRVSTESNHTHSVIESGDHSHYVLGGDKETRPKNMIVNFYIKIEDSKDCSAIKVDPSLKSTISEKFECLASNLKRIQNSETSTTEYEKTMIIRELHAIKQQFSSKLGSSQNKYFDDVIMEHYSDYLL